MERRPEATSQTAAYKQQRTSKPTEEINLTQKIHELKEKVSFNALDISTLTKYFEQKCLDFKAGSTARMIPAWRNLTSDKMILDSVRGITIPLDTQPNQIRVSPNPKFNDTETLAINTEIERLLGKEVIEQVPHESGEIISPIFVRVKKDGRFRLILNLKEFNKSVSYNHFKMDTLQTITNLMTQNCFMASVDLKDAYYSIPVHRSHRKYLKFF
jgi:hypothetical protein